MYWEGAPDHRTSCTPDWLNDACEARLKKKDRAAHGEVKYEALMSPLSIDFSGLSALRFDWKHPFAQANRAKLLPGKRRYAGQSPISLLLTTEVEKTQADGTTEQVRYVLLGTKKRFGRRATVSKHKYRRTEHLCDSLQTPDDYRFMLNVSPATVVVLFATKFEVNVLVDHSGPESKPQAEPAAANRGP
jgi:hypothetical protein